VEPPTLCDPNTHPLADAYVTAATPDERRAALEYWRDSDEARAYRYRISAEGLASPMPSRPTRREPPHECRPSDARFYLYRWARAWMDEIDRRGTPQHETYWITCRAYQIDPRTGHTGRTPAVEYVLRVHPEAPTCTDSNPCHLWRAADPAPGHGSYSVTWICDRCGLRHECRARHSESNPRPWHRYTRNP